MIMIKSVPKLSVIFLLLLSMLAGTLSSCISRNNTDEIQTGIASDESTSGQNENESQTNEVIDIVTFPDGNLPDLSSLLEGEDNSINSVYDFRNASVSSLKTDGNLTFVQQSDYISDEHGLSTDNSDWKSVGFSTEITSPDYTVEAKFTVSENEKDGNLNAFLVGIRCISADNLFIDGGIWFAFRDNTLEDIMTSLARWYDFTPRFDNEEARHIRLSGQLGRREDIRTLLHSFELTADVKFHIQADTIIITSNH